MYMRMRHIYNMGMPTGLDTSFKKKNLKHGHGKDVSIKMYILKSVSIVLYNKEIQI